jgi:hypothetical protein
MEATKPSHLKVTTPDTFK